MSLFYQKCFLFIVSEKFRTRKGCISSKIKHNKSKQCADELFECVWPFFEIGVSFNILINYILMKKQKHSSRDVLRKRCSENMQHIYRRTPLPKCHFNEVALQLSWNQTSAFVFSCKYAAYFQYIFSKNTNWGLLLKKVCSKNNKIFNP